MRGSHDASGHWRIVFANVRDVLRDLYVRGKYRDVILRITVLRRLDAVLEPTKPNRPPDVCCTLRLTALYRY
jgi:hypothetical protein